MADVAEGTDISTSGSDAGTESSTDGAALTPEQRDIQTFAKYGMNPDGSPIQTQAAPANKADEADADGGDDADDKSSDDEADDEGDDADATSTADADDEDDDADETEITDERLDSIIDAALELNADRVKKNPKLRDQLREELRQELEAEYEGRQRTTTASQERERLIGQGKGAVNTVTSLLTTAREELAKAAKGEGDFNAEVLADAEKTLQRSFGAFGAAAVADTRRSYDDAFAAGFKAAVAESGPLTEDEAKAIGAIVNAANRIEADETQGDERFDAAKRHYYVEVFKLLSSRAKTAGRTAAVAEAKAKKDARKTILDTDAVLAGAAKEAKNRGKLPPSPTQAKTTESEPQGTMEAYRAAKAAKDFALADRIMAKMQASQPRGR